MDQLDGYFNGGTAPWMISSGDSNSKILTTSPRGVQEVPDDAPLLNDAPHDDTWFRRGVAVYKGLNSTDPEAIWSFQGFSFVGWSTPQQASFVKGFVDAVPKGKFVIIDMSYNEAEWKKWNNASFFGASFIWTTLHNYGGTDGIRGDLARVNNIPFDAILEPRTSSIIGSGATTEGIDQNPAYHEFVYEQPFRTAPVPNLTAHMIQRSHQRYGLIEQNQDVSKAWAFLVDSLYATDMNVQDHTGIAHLQPRGGDVSSLFVLDRYTPKPIICKIFGAWQHLLRAASTSAHPGFQTEPFLYDLVNLGREVLAQIATPAALNCSDATARDTLDKSELGRMGTFYIELLHDADTLVATDTAFLLGPWIEAARRWGVNSNDCDSHVLAINKNMNKDKCEWFYEWNARTQITTWNPTPKASPKIPGGPVDYAAKHWSGLIKDYYGKRAALLMKQALQDQAAGQPLDQSRVDRRFAQHAYEWTTDMNKYPTHTTGDALQVS